MLILKTVNGQKAFVSPRYIEYIKEDNGVSLIQFNSGEWLSVEDTFDEIMDALKRLAAPQLPQVSPIFPLGNK